MAEIGTLGDIVFKVSANKVRTFDDLKIENQLCKTHKAS